MAGTSEGGRKAALTRGHKSLSEAGRKGGINSQLNRKANAARVKNSQPDNVSASQSSNPS